MHRNGAPADTVGVIGVAIALVGQAVPADAQGLAAALEQAGVLGGEPGLDGEVAVGLRLRRRRKSDGNSRCGEGQRAAHRACRICMGRG